MQPRLTHIALHVEQLEPCVQFYEKYCGLRIIHRRQHKHKQVVWLAEQGREQDFVMVLLPGGHKQQARIDDFSHLGFAVDSKAQVDVIAKLAEEDGILVWPPIQEDFPVGYYCGVLDPNGHYVEFSYGQPLGPGAEASKLD